MRCGVVVGCAGDLDWGAAGEGCGWGDQGGVGKGGEGEGGGGQVGWLEGLQHAWTLMSFWTRTGPGQRCQPLRAQGILAMALHRACGYVSRFPSRRAQNTRQGEAIDDLYAKRASRTAWLTEGGICLAHEELRTGVRPSGRERERTAQKRPAQYRHRAAPPTGARS